MVSQHWNAAQIIYVIYACLSVITLRSRAALHNTYFLIKNHGFISLLCMYKNVACS